MRYMNDSERYTWQRGLPLTLEEVDLRTEDVIAGEVEGLTLINCCAEGLDFQLCIFYNLTARGTNFHGASFNTCEFEPGLFEACNLSATNFTGAMGAIRFEDCETKDWISPMVLDQAPQDAPPALPNATQDPSGLPTETASDLVQSLNAAPGDTLPSEVPTGTPGAGEGGAQ